MSEEDILIAMEKISKQAEEDE